jgi:hypothetical protein
MFMIGLLDQEIQFAHDNSLYAYLSIDPLPYCPDWVYKTVPKLLTDYKGWNENFLTTIMRISSRITLI